MGGRGRTRCRVERDQGTTGSVSALSMLLPLLVGMVTCHLLATGQVFLGNRELHARLKSVTESGFLPVPSLDVQPGLQDPASAFWAGLLFALSLGTGLSLVVFVLLGIWDRLFRRNPCVLSVYGLVWAAVLLAANARGFSPFGGLYFLFIPLSVGACALPLLRRFRFMSTFRELLFMGAPLLVLGLLWASQFDGVLFVGLRDNLLLSNAPGRKISSFYYRHAFHAAEVFKPLDQKLVKTCRLDRIESRDILEPLRALLLKYDYVPVVQSRAVDMEVAESARRVLFYQGKELIVSAAWDDVRREPKALLAAFSAGCDRDSFLRSALFISLLLGFPVFLYAGAYVALYRAAVCFFGATASWLFASGGVLLVGVGLLLPLANGAREPATAATVRSLIESPSLQDRIEGLKRSVTQGVDIGPLACGEKILDSPDLLERYWAARALGISRSTGALDCLTRLMDDPQENVACRAISSLGGLNDSRAIPNILARLKTSKSWYVQWHAYKTLKRLGWHQGL